MSNVPMNRFELEIWVNGKIQKRLGSHSGRVSPTVAKKYKQLQAFKQKHELRKALKEMDDI